MDLNKEVRYVKGVGPAREKQLNRLKIFTLKDLLFYIPRDYDDRSLLKNFNEVEINEKATVKVKVLEEGQITKPRRNMNILNIPVTDGRSSGFLTFFNQGFLKNQFKKGDIYLVNGKVTRYRGNYQMTNPIYDKTIGDKVGKINSVYPLTKGLSDNVITNIIRNAFIENINYIKEIMPKSIIKKLGLIERKEALYNMHFPENFDQLTRSRNRMVLEELLIFQLALNYLTKDDENTQAIKFEKYKIAEDFIKSLPFKLTNAQLRVFNEIKDDMSSLKKMNRLVQGDVGSGKTIIALLSMLIAFENGYQSAYMAPTELLTEQHFQSLVNFTKDLDINIELLTGSHSKKQKEEIYSRLKSKEIDIIIGTHALIQKGVEYSNLGLVITDEQHRFGVKQRASLANKAKAPDIITMTATPIPRTMALIFYGDLDISIIDELPQGRKEIKSYAVNMYNIKKVNDFTKKQLDEGRQAYIVCPLIEESEVLDIKSVEEVYRELKNCDFKDYKLGLLHGQLKSDEKTKIMRDFQKGNIDILVSTTVIEVGVDVKNANTMIIYNAERFGLSQLHQIRGRVGRGDYQSYCILLNDAKTDVAKERMEIMESSTDGAVISEKDLNLRGPGEFLGERQHGISDFKFADLARDLKIFYLARDLKEEILKKDPNLESEENKDLKNAVLEKVNNINELVTKD